MCIFLAPAAGGTVFSTAAGAAAANMALVSLATTAATMRQQEIQVKAQNKMMTQREEEGTKLAKANYDNQVAQATQRTLQEREAAADEISKVTREARKATALASMSAAQRGVMGQGVDQLYADFEAQEMRYHTQVQRSLGFREQAIQDNLESARRGYQSNIMNLQFMPRTGPNILAGALQVGGAAYGTYNQYSFKGPPLTATPNAATRTPGVS